MDSLFSDSYLQADERFYCASNEAGATVMSAHHPLCGPSGEALRIIVSRVGAEDAGHVVLVTSGTHGVEGYAGSAVQTGIMGQLRESPPPRDTAVVMIHAVNPWGFAWDRRENEDNIDLFRNFIYCQPPFSENRLYDQLNSAINPSQWSGPARDRAERAIAKFVAAHGHDAYIAVVRRGQHRHPRGLTYHGRGPSWSKRQVDELARRVIRPSAKVANLEIHTSWGALNQCLAISYAFEGTAKLERTRRWLGSPLYLPGEDPLIPPHARTPFETLESVIEGIEVTAVVMECGTYDGDMPLDVDRHSNFIFTRGDPTSTDGLFARATMRRYCYPESDAWKSIVWNTGQHIFQQLLKGVHDW